MSEEQIVSLISKITGVDKMVVVKTMEEFMDNLKTVFLALER